MHLKSSIGAQGTSGEFKAMFATFSVILSPAEFYNILIDAGVPYSTTQISKPATIKFSPEDSKL